jgi:transcriptional regulator with XRE-family HTH domain
VNNIKLLRMQLNLTIRELSFKADVATGYISMLENDIGGQTNPTKDVMTRIAKALNSTVSEVFFSTEV